MFGWLKSNAARRRTGQQLYEIIVAQARRPAFYRDLGVPDTMDGRLEMILLHLVMVLDQLKREGSQTQKLGQLLMETFVADMDDALRQIGIGDDGVVHRIKRLGRAIAERGRDYAAAFAALDAAQLAPERAQAAMALAQALAAHVLQVPSNAAGTPAVGAEAHRLAAYVAEVRRLLLDLPHGSVGAGRLAFPDIDHWSNLETSR